MGIPKLQDSCTLKVTTLNSWDRKIFLGKKFSLIPGDVLCEQDEVFDIVNVDIELPMCKDAYLGLVARSP